MLKNLKLKKEQLWNHYMYMYCFIIPTCPMNYLYLQFLNAVIHWIYDVSELPMELLCINMKYMYTM